MRSLVKVQRRLRLVDSPYRTPQTLVGGPRVDAALMASTGRTATTRAMGRGSTQFQHLVHTEVPTKTLEAWLAIWAEHHAEVLAGSPIGSQAAGAAKGETGEASEAARPGAPGRDTTGGGSAVSPPQRFEVRLRPYSAGSEVLELSVRHGTNQLANLIFAVIKDRRNRAILSVRDQNTLVVELRRKRLMLLLHLFLAARYKAASVHYLTPTEDNRLQAASMLRLGLFELVSEEVGEIIVADVNEDVVSDLLGSDAAVEALIKGRSGA